MPLKENVNSSIPGNISTPIAVPDLGLIKGIRVTDPDVFTNPDSARIRARQLGCIGVRRYVSDNGTLVWKPCTNESDFRREMGISNSGRLQRRREIQQEVSRFVRGKALEEIDLKSGNYTKPELRESIKRRVMAGSSGGKPGQWSARKAQLVAQAYRKAGGGYRGGKNKRQRSLSKWTKEKWSTSDKKPAIRSGGTRRYLPRAAWARLTPAQIKATNRKKLQGSRSGRQFVSNTNAAMRASKNSRKHLLDLQYEQKALGSTIGRMGRGVAARFNPDARDADGDKLIQEGTIYERPDTPNIPRPDDAPPSGIPRPNDDAPPRGIPRPNLSDNTSGQTVRKPVERTSPGGRESVATRMRRLDSTRSSALTGRVAEVGEDGQVYDTFLTISELNPIPIQGRSRDKGFIKQVKSTMTQDVLHFLVDYMGVYDALVGSKGDHHPIARDFMVDEEIVLPDGTKQKTGKRIIKTMYHAVWGKAKPDTMRQKTEAKGFFFIPAKGNRPKNDGNWVHKTEIGYASYKQALDKFLELEISPEQKKAIAQAATELFEADSKKVRRWPGFLAINKRAEDILDKPIGVDLVESYFQKVPEFVQFENRSDATQTALNRYESLRDLTKHLAKKFKIPLREVTFTGDNNTVFSNKFNSEFKNKQTFPELEELFPDAVELVLAAWGGKDQGSLSVNSKLLQGIIDDEIDGTNLYAEKNAITDRDEFRIYLKAKKADEDFVSSLSDKQIINLTNEIESFKRDPDKAKGDLDLFIGDDPEMPILPYLLVGEARRSIPRGLLQQITQNDRAINPRFQEFAELRENLINKKQYQSQLSEVEQQLSLTGKMSTPDRRGNRVSRLDRRTNSASLTGAMTGDERRSDYVRKQRVWQSNIIAQVMAVVQTEQTRRENFTDEELAKEPALPFKNWFQQFGSLDITTITGGSGQTSSFSHRLVDQLFNRLKAEWGSDEAAIFGEKPNFKVYDAPMSASDINAISENKRLIVGTFLDEIVKLDPSSQFATYSAQSATDDEIDMIFRTYVIPELIKPQSVMPMEDLPFEIDPSTLENIRNYADYLTFKKLGVDGTLTDQEFDDAVDELFVDNPAQQFNDFVESLNEAYDRYQEDGFLPGQFVDENLINPSTGNIYTKEEWRASIDQTSEELLESTSELIKATQKYEDVTGMYNFLFAVGLSLGYITPEDHETMQDELEDAADEVAEEIDPLENLDPKDLTFDPANRTNMTQDPRLAWIWNLFVKGGKDWAYPLAERYHQSDIQQERYVRPDFQQNGQHSPPPSEFLDFSNVEFDGLLALIEAANSYSSDILADLPGVKTLIGKSKDVDNAKKDNDYKNFGYKNKTAAAVAKRDLIWTLLTTDGLTPEEISAKANVHPDVVDKILDKEATARGVDATGMRNFKRIASNGANGREEDFKQDLLARELKRIKQIGSRSPQDYLEKLREARQYYKDVSKQANASYSQARRRYAELQTLAYWLLQGLPDGPRDFDPKKESAVGFKNRWLKALENIADPIAMIAKQISVQQWQGEDRKSASSRILERANRMISELDGQIESTEKLLKISDAEALKARHNIAALSAVRDIARSAVRGQYPNMTDEEIDKVLGTGGLTGQMSSGIRNARMSKKARRLMADTSQNVDPKLGLLQRTGNLIPLAKAQPRVMALAKWFDSVPDKGMLVGTNAKKRNRKKRGIFASSDDSNSTLAKISRSISRMNQTDFGLGRSREERALIRNINTEARRSKTNVSRYFDGRDDDEDVAWSSNDWSFARSNPIRGADIVVYRVNPEIKNPEDAVEVLVISRKSGPFTGANALPGGLNDDGETLVETAMREMEEEVGISAVGMRVRNLGIVQSRDWDPRFVEGVTVQGMSVRVPYDTQPTAGSDAKKASFITLSEILGGDNHIAFGHSSFLREALQTEAPKSSRKLSVHERAGRVRNRRLIEKINGRRRAAGQPEFPVLSDEQIRNGFEIIRSNDPRYANLNDPSGSAESLTGRMSERYDIKQNADKTYSIVDTQNGNMAIAGPFKTRQQAVYGAIRKDKEPGFDPQTLLGKRKNRANKKATKKVVTKIKQPSLFDENDSANRLDQSKQGGLTGAMTSGDLLTALGINPTLDMTIQPGTNQARFPITTSTDVHYFDSSGFNDPISQMRIQISRARYNDLWVPYRDSVSSIVPDSQESARPVLYILGGAPGSLKTTIRESGLGGIPDRNQAVTVDVDEAKQIMPEYRSGIENSFSGIAGIVHEESKGIAQNALFAAIQTGIAKMTLFKRGKDIVYDSLGQFNDSEVARQVQAAKKAGYKIVGMYFWAPQDVSKARLKERAKTTGRAVSDYYDPVMGNVRKLFRNQGTRSNGSEVQNIFDGIVIYDTTNPQFVQRVGTWLGPNAPSELEVPRNRTPSSRNTGDFYDEPYVDAQGFIVQSSALQEFMTDNLGN